MAFRYNESTTILDHLQEGESYRTEHNNIVCFHYNYLDLSHIPVHDISYFLKTVPWSFNCGHILPNKKIENSFVDRVARC